MKYSAFSVRTGTAGGSTIAPEEIVDASRAEAEEGETWLEARENIELLDAIGREFDAKRFEAGELSPVFFGSALTNFGVRLILDAMVDLVPSPSPRLDIAADPRPLDAPFSGIVFKVQANMDKLHRDRVAFVRVPAGRRRRPGRNPGWTRGSG